MIFLVRITYCLTHINPLIYQSNITVVIPRDYWTYNVTSHDFSWLQNGQLNRDGIGSMILRFGGGLVAFLRRPMLLAFCCTSSAKCEYESCLWSLINSIFTDSSDNQIWKRVNHYTKFGTIKLCSGIGWQKKKTNVI